MINLSKSKKHHQNHKEKSLLTFKLIRKIIVGQAYVRLAYVHHNLKLKIDITLIQIFIAMAQ